MMVTLMNKYPGDEKIIRMRMIEKDIKTINELAEKSGVSKPIIYEYLNGKSPFNNTFIKLCDILEVDPLEFVEINKKEIL